jgi:transposase-like protein
MSKGTTGEADVIRLRENIQDLLRRRVLEAVQTVLEEELREALGTSRYEPSLPTWVHPRVHGRDELEGGARFEKRPGLAVVSNADLGPVG